MKHEPILNVFLLFWETLISKKKKKVKTVKKEARNMEETGSILKRNVK